MIKSAERWIFTFTLILFTAFSCSKAVVIGGRVNPEQLTDGVFEGEFKHGLNSAIVQVTVENEKIIRVEIVKHDAWKGKKVEPIIPKRIVESQSTNVDAVTGATNSSRVIMNAVQKAIENSYLSKQNK